MVTVMVACAMIAIGIYATAAGFSHYYARLVDAGTAFVVAGAVTIFARGLEAFIAWLT